jgi:hypothetical protein
MHIQGNQSFKKYPAFSFRKISSSPKHFPSDFRKGGRGGGKFVLMKLRNRKRKSRASGPRQL